MKKILLFLLTTVFIWASSVTDVYLDYTNKLINYHFNLKDFEKIEAPFEIKVKIIAGKKVKNTQNLVKIIKINLLSILNQNAYVLINEYLGEQLTKSYKKWIKIDDIIGDCKVKKITIDKVLFKCKNKTLIKTLNKKIPGIKEKQ